MATLDKINKDKLPKHIAVIMDGNGRWAKQKGNARVFGHKHGVNGVKETSEACAELGIEYLTLYAFSTENWNRPKFEVNALMELLISTIKSETKTLQKNNIRLKTIGNINDLPKKTLNKLNEAIEATKNNNGLTLILALSYSSKSEIIDAIKCIANKVKDDNFPIEDINEELISDSLYTKDYPDPDLMIRTSGEQRISNFLMWQLAYAELYFTETLWPDFNKEELYKAILAYQNRERRFGKTSEQLNEQLP
jgi:undecaprenyl diphosphate synthase